MFRFVVLVVLVFTAQASAAGDLPVRIKSDDEVRVDALVKSIRQEVKSGQFGRAKLLVVAARQGSGGACALLGWMFDNGKGVRRDSGKALQWFESCAKSEPLAAYNAGVLYAEGRGTNKNMSKAVQMMELAWSIGGSSFRATMQQIPIRLAFYYYDQKSYGNAWTWGERSAEFNARYGKYLLGRLLVEKHGSGETGNALLYLNAAVEAYSHPAAKLLAWCYGTGRFSKKDFMLAHQYAVIARKMASAAGADAQDWGGSLDVVERKRSEMKADQWMSEHRQPKEIDFGTTLDGTEEQFKR